MKKKTYTEMSMFDAESENEAVSPAKKSDLSEVSIHRSASPSPFVLDPVSSDPAVGRAFMRLSSSDFRSRFRISNEDFTYALRKGRAVTLTHTRHFIRERLAPAFPDNDGKQTPMRGHPAFTAQHATATCCRSCLEKWHHIPQGRSLTDGEIEYAVSLIMEWIDRQVKWDE